MIDRKLTEEELSAIKPVIKAAWYFLASAIRAGIDLKEEIGNGNVETNKIINILRKSE